MVSTRSRRLAPEVADGLVDRHVRPEPHVARVHEAAGRVLGVGEQRAHLAAGGVVEQRQERGALPAGGSAGPRRPRRPAPAAASRRAARGRRQGEEQPLVGGRAFDEEVHLLSVGEHPEALFPLLRREHVPAVAQLDVREALLLLHRRGWHARSRRTSPPARPAPRRSVAVPLWFRPRSSTRGS